MINLFNWRARAKAAEAALQTAREHLQGIEARMADRAVLISIAKTDGRAVRLTFVRNGELFTLDTFVTMDFNLTRTRKLLLE